MAGGEKSGVALVLDKDDARLIAAAPELLRVLKELHGGTRFSDDPVQLAISKKCADAIAKAEGK